MRFLTSVYKFTLPLLLLTVIGLSVNACIKDDYDDCLKGDISLSFIFEKNIDSLDKFQALVDNIEIVVYDLNTNKAVKQYSLTEQELIDQNYIQQFYVPPGNYKAVAWMNTNDAEYPMASMDNLDNARVRALMSDFGEVVNGMTDIYYSAGGFVIEKVQVQKNIELSFVKDTKKITVNTEFTNDLSLVGQTIRIRLSSTHGVYDFHNECIPNSPLRRYIPKYTPDSSASSHKQKVSGMFSTVQKMWDRDDLLLEIFVSEVGKEDKLIHETMLTKAIMLNPIYGSNEKLDYYDDLEYNIKFNNETETFIVVHIDIKGWTIFDDPVIIG